MLRRIVSGLLAGIMIAIGGCVYLSLYAENKIVGALLFSVALMTICYCGYALFTGGVGFIPQSHKKDDISSLLLGLFGNAIGTILCGLAIRFTLTNTHKTAEYICGLKLEQSIPEVLVRSAFCGVLMYVAVKLYREHKTILGVFLCIPVFILSGFEHSVANMFYFATSGIVSFDAFGYIWLCILGNTVGGMLLPLLTMLGGIKNADKQ